MSNKPESSGAAEVTQPGSVRAITNKRLNELLVHRGSVTLQIVKLQKALEGIDKQIEALNESAPFLAIAEKQIRDAVNVTTTQLRDKLETANKYAIDLQIVIEKLERRNNDS